PWARWCPPAPSPNPTLAFPRLARSAVLSVAPGLWNLGEPRTVPACRARPGRPRCPTSASYRARSFAQGTSDLAIGLRAGVPGGVLDDRATEGRCLSESDRPGDCGFQHRQAEASHGVLQYPAPVTDACVEHRRDHTRHAQRRIRESAHIVDCLQELGYS